MIAWMERWWPLLVAVVGTGFAFLRFVFEPHVARIITRVIERRERSREHEQQRKAQEWQEWRGKVEDLEVRMTEQEKNGALIVQSIAEMTKGFERLTKTLERVDERSEKTVESVARIEGSMERRSRSGQ